MRGKEPLRGKGGGLFDTYTYMYDFVYMKSLHSASGTSLSILSTALSLGLWSTFAWAQDGVMSEPEGPVHPSVALETTVLRGPHYVADLEGGGLAQLTLHPALQKSVEDALASHHFPFAAAAVISIPDGKVLVLAGYSKIDPTLDASTLALRPWAPA